MMKRFLTVVVLGMVPNLAIADGDFGTLEEAEKIATAMIAIVDTKGVEAAIEAMHDGDYPFVGTRMGVNLFSGSTVIADNREPETIAADYSETADLTGTLVWPLIAAAAEEGRDANLKWYHYDTQESYDYKCYSLGASTAAATVMVCR